MSSQENPQRFPEEPKQQPKNEIQNQKWIKNVRTFSRRQKEPFVEPSKMKIALFPKMVLYHIFEFIFIIGNFSFFVEPLRVFLRRQL